MNKLQFLLTKEGFFVDDIPYVEKEIQKYAQGFATVPYETLYELAFLERPEFLDATGMFLFQIAETFVERLVKTSGLELSREKTELVPNEETIELLLDSVPFVIGAEFVTRTWIKRQYRKLLAVFAKQIKSFSGNVSLYFAEKNQKLHVPERVFFHLVENSEGEYPFAFLATYATRGDGGRVRHVPLQYALTEYQNERSKLLELLSCLNKAAEVSALIGRFMESGELFHPLGLTADEAYMFLNDVTELEDCGILCRIPNWWKKRYNAFAVTVKIGEEKPSLLSLNAVLHMAPSLTIGGVPLTEEEIRNLLNQTEGLSLIKGKWVEVNHARLKKLLAEMKQYDGDITLIEALRSEVYNADDEKNNEPVVTNGRWLSGLLKSLRSPRNQKSIGVPNGFNGELRLYQEVGYQWLLQMNRLGFGACLADDMGLGKTVQILAFLEALRTQKPNGKVLLVVPASLLGNWQKEAARFTPDLSIDILHGARAATLSDRFLQSDAFLTITTYRMAMSVEALENPLWDCIILDEAQAIKNPAAKQTRQIKKFESRMRIALTGTPIENDLSNLWSLFDFLNKGLLGSMDEFRCFCRGLEKKPEGYAKLKNMIAPFLLRRVKTDKKIISDLPDKLEQLDYVGLSSKQTVLYRKLLAETKEKVENSGGIQRRGIVLGLLLHLKQICNHPDQYLGNEEYNPAQSGKFELLKQLAQTIAEKRERVLVFTQFKELTGHLDDCLADVFGRRGGVIHGGVPVKERNAIVERFQSESYVPYLVLSVKAGGTGLNLTKANHVIHFDRWWNPAVENQATDRAFRIGQHKNVMVHKFVCKGSVEEKIDVLISSKKELAENVIGAGGESWITEMSNDELMKLLRLEA